MEKTTYQGFQYGYCAPMLVQTNYSDSWCLVTESASLSTIAASTLVKGSKTGSVRLEIVKHGNKLGVADPMSCIGSCHFYLRLCLSSCRCCECYLFAVTLQREK